MKLAEALSERSALKDRMSMLSKRLQENAFVYEGDEPLDDPKEMLKELEMLTKRNEELVSSINMANANTKASNGEVLAVLLARRDSLITKSQVLSKLLESNPHDPYSSRTKDTVRRVPVVDMRTVRLEMEEASKKAREIDALIQATNWNTEI